MWSKLIKPGFCMAGIFFPFASNTDTTVEEQETERSRLIALDATGWGRVKKMFTIDEFGNVSKEVVTVSNVWTFSLLAGLFYGGVTQSRIAYRDFIQHNQATTFQNSFEAKKTLQDKVTVAFGKGAFKWGWRLSVFCSGFVGFTTTIAAYRGKHGIAEYIAGGFLIGSLYRWNLGPRAMLVGGGLGSVLGLACGCTSFALLKAFGLSMDEILEWHKVMQERRDQAFGENIKKRVEGEAESLRLAHEAKVGESGKTLENIKA